MTAHVLLNLLNELRKRDKMRHLQSHCVVSLSTIYCLVLVQPRKTGNRYMTENC